MVRKLCEVNDVKWLATHKKCKVTTHKRCLCYLYPTQWCQAGLCHCLPWLPVSLFYTFILDKIKINHKWVIILSNLQLSYPKSGIKNAQTLTKYRARYFMMHNFQLGDNTGLILRPNLINPVLALLFLAVSGHSAVLPYLPVLEQTASSLAFTLSINICTPPIASPCQSLLTLSLVLFSHRFPLSPPFTFFLSPPLLPVGRRDVSQAVICK